MLFDEIFGLVGLLVLCDGDLLVSWNVSCVVNFLWFFVGYLVECVELVLYLFEGVGEVFW